MPGKGSLITSALEVAGKTATAVKNDTSVAVALSETSAGKLVLEAVHAVYKGSKPLTITPQVSEMIAPAIVTGRKTTAAFGPHVFKLPNSQITDGIRSGFATAVLDAEVPGKVVGVTKMSGPELGKLADSFSIALQKTAELPTNNPRARAIAVDGVQTYFESNITPHLRSMGVKVTHWADPDMGQAGMFADIPMNSSFRAGNSVIDLNTAGGLRALPKPVMKRLWPYGHYGQAPTEFDLATAAATQILPAESRTLMFLKQADGSVRRRLVDPSFMRDLREGRERVVSADFGMVITNRFKDAAQNERSLYVKLEETAHLFQNLNGGRPLSRLGVQAQEAYAAEAATMEKLTGAAYRSPHRIVVEHDITGIFQHFGIQLDAKFLGHYERGLVRNYLGLNPAERKELSKMLDLFGTPKGKKVPLDLRHQIAEGWMTGNQQQRREFFFGVRNYVQGK